MLKQKDSHFTKLRLKKDGKGFEGIGRIGSACGHIDRAALRTNQCQEIENAFAVDLVSTLQNPYVRLELIGNLDNLGGNARVNAKFVSDDEFPLHYIHIFSDTELHTHFIPKPQFPPSLSTCPS